MAPLTSTEIRSAKENTRSMSCSIKSTVTSRGSAATAAEPFGYRKPNGLERRQIGIKLVDLEGARQPAQHAAVNRQIGDVVTLEHDPPGVGLEHAGEQVDHGGLAGAVRPNQGVAG